MEPPRPRGVPWGPQLVSELQGNNLRLRQYGLEIPGLGRAAYRVGQVRSRLQKERSL